jgi:cytochrome oxidase Cu insertion factor (SCO1/SenC/PrrC family)
MTRHSFYLRGPALRLLLLALLLLLVIISTLARAHAEEKPPRDSDHDYDAPAPGTYQLPVIKMAADAALLDAASKPIGLAELTRGRVTILSFIYTRCASAKACPMATGVLMDLHELSADDRELAKNLRLVSMSFDPAHDTPERMRAYSELASGRPNAAPWHFVTARSERELQPVLAAYGQAVDKKANAADPTGPLNHTLRVYLIDREGRIRNIYSSGTLDVRLVLADVRTLLLEKRTP